MGGRTLWHCGSVPLGWGCQAGRGGGTKERGRQVREPRGACSGLIALNQPCCTKVLPPWLEISCPLSAAPISRRGCQSPLSYQTQGLSQLPDSAGISSCAHEVWVVVNLILIKADYKYPLEMSLCIYRDSRTKTPRQQMFQGKQNEGTVWANGAWKTWRTKLRIWSNAHKSLSEILTKFTFKWLRATPDNSVLHTHACTQVLTNGNTLQHLRLPARTCG